MTEPSSDLHGEAEPVIPYVPEEAVLQRLGHVVGPYMERMGFLPNAVKLYAHRPEIAEALFRLNDSIMRDPSSTLDRRLKRRLGTIASSTNGCTYCLSHNCAILTQLPDVPGEGWGYTGEAVGEMLAPDYQPQDEFESACVDFVRTASADASNVPDEVLHRLGRHLTEPQIIELACVVGFWKFYNTVHASLHVPLEAHLLDVRDGIDP